MNVQEIALDRITIPPHLHRKILDAAALERLAASIKDVGLMNPITVEAAGDHFILRAGHRRLEAHRLLRRDAIPANVRNPADLGNGEVLTWTENLEREDLTPIEQAEACQRMVTRGNLLPTTIAKMLRRSVDWVEERLALLDLPTDLQQHVHTRDLPMRHALELGRITDPPHRDYLTRYALMSGASFTVLRDWVAQWRLHDQNPSGAAAPLPPMPGPGERIVILIPCLTCGEAHPPHEMRAAHICLNCHATVLDATAEWRTAAAPPAGNASAPSDANDSAPPTPRLAGK